MAQNSLPRIIEVVGDALYPRQAQQPEAYFSPQAAMAS